MKRATVTVSADAVAGDISIHALVKRATITQGAAVFFRDISIHALVKRATGRDSV